MSDKVTVYDPEGTKRLMDRANATDHVQHLRWSWSWKLPQPKKDADHE